MIRTLLWWAIILFWIIWKPEGESAQIGQYFVIGNIILIIILMELLPLWFSYHYRTIISLLEHFASSYDTPLQYSYTPVVVIRSDIYNTDNTSYLTQTQYQSDKFFFTIYHESNLYEFSTDLTQKQQVIDLASVIIYYLQKDIPYEILHQHSKRLQDNLSS
jgi:voltage-gated potassium channel Kch